MTAQAAATISIDVCQSQSSINSGVTNPARTPPRVTPLCRIEKISGRRRCGVTRANMCELAGVEGPSAAPMKALPSETRTSDPVAIRAGPITQRKTNNWVARMGLIRATHELASTPKNIAAIKTMVGWAPIQIGSSPISGSACLAITGGANTAHEIIVWVRVRRITGPT